MFAYATMITVSILDRFLPHASAAYVQISVFYRKFPESLGTSKMRVKLQYLGSQTSKKGHKDFAFTSTEFISILSE